MQETGSSSSIPDDGRRKSSGPDETRLRPRSSSSTPRARKKAVEAIVAEAEKMAGPDVHALRAVRRIEVPGFGELPLIENGRDFDAWRREVERQERQERPAGGGSGGDCVHGEVAQ